MKKYELSLGDMVSYYNDDKKTYNNMLINSMFISFFGIEALCISTNTRTLPSIIVQGGIVCIMTNQLIKILKDKEALKKSEKFLSLFVDKLDIDGIDMNSLKNTKVEKEDRLYDNYVNYIHFIDNDLVIIEEKINNNKHYTFVDKDNIKDITKVINGVKKNEI